MLKTVIFYGSYRSDRQGIKASKFIISQLKQRNHETEFADAIEYDFGILDRMYKEFKPDQIPAKMEDLANHIRTADGFVIVAGEYNHSIQPGLSNLMDHYLEEYYFRPAAIVSYSVSSIAGMRAAMQLRCFLAEMGMPTISTILPIPNIAESLNDEGMAQDQTLVQKAVKFLDELEWYQEALKHQKQVRGTPF